MNTPILFIIFNRPDTTQRVFEAIRLVRPKYLYVAADGPRSKNTEDGSNCTEARAIIDQVDWDCEVKRLFRNDNLGCRIAVSSAINWFFENVEEGIILEDDCLPHPDFFRFSQQMLEYYRDNSKVMHITGGNFQFGRKRGSSSYYYSRIPHIWGWATWRRAWRTYQLGMEDFPAFIREDGRSRYFHDAQSEKYWLFHFRRVYKKTSTWDYQWSYAVMKNLGYCITPNVNLISNIGFGNQATHAASIDDPVANLPVEALGEITHPMEFSINDDADLFTITHAFPIPSLFKRAVNKIIRTVKNF